MVFMASTGGHVWKRTVLGLAGRKRRQNSIASKDLSPCNAYFISAKCIHVNLSDREGVKMNLRVGKSCNHTVIHEQSVTKLTRFHQEVGYWRRLVTLDLTVLERGCHMW